MKEKLSKIIIQSQSESKLINCEDIIYCKAEGNYTRIYFQHNSILVTRTLRNIESHLIKGLFIRIHRSFIVNKNYVIGYKHCNKLILSIDVELPIARRKKTETLAKIFDSITAI